MTKIKNNIYYMEGNWASKTMAKNIELTTYKSLENAIKAKTILIEQFEEQFGFSRDMEEFDNKYAYELGILDGLTEIYNNKN